VAEWNFPAKGVVFMYDIFIFLLFFRVNLFEKKTMIHILRQTTTLKTKWAEARAIGGT
jgi:hypothetical protein